MTWGSQTSPGTDTSGWSILARLFRPVLIMDGFETGDASRWSATELGVVAQPHARQLPGVPLRGRGVVTSGAMVAGRIRDAVAGDGEALAGIYNHYVTGTIVTFEEVPVAGAEMAARIASVQAAGLPWLVAEESGQVIGYAYASPWKPRSGYRFSVEVTVYLEPGREGRGWGTRLYQRLFEMLAGRGIHFVAGGIALPNPASVALHEKMGMTRVAHFRENGVKFGRWIDVGYWQRLL